MPDRPFVPVCQQCLADPTRSRGDVHAAYAYAHVPAGFDADATAAIEAQIERFPPGSPTACWRRAARSRRVSARSRDSLHPERLK